MQASFWALDAAKSKEKEIVPGTSKWIAKELYTLNSHVLSSARTLYSTVLKDIDDLDKFMNDLTNGNELKLISALDNVDTTYSEISSSTDLGRVVKSNTGLNATFNQKLEHKSSHENHLKRQKLGLLPSRSNNGANNQVKKIVTPDKEEPFNATSDQMKSSPLKAENMGDMLEHAVDKKNPFTPSPLKLQFARSDESTINSNLSFIPIVPNSAELKKRTPIISEGEFLDKDGSFQEIRTAIRKSNAHKSINLVDKNTEIFDTNNKNDENKRHDMKSYTESSVINSEKSASINSKQDRSEVGSLKPTLKFGNTDVHKMITKTPKRASVFATLPSREPLPLTSSTKSSKFSIAAQYPQSLENEQQSFKRIDVIPLKNRTPSNRKLTLHDIQPRIDSNYIRQSLKRRSSIRHIRTDQRISLGEKGKGLSEAKRQNYDQIANEKGLSDLNDGAAFGGSQMKTQEHNLKKSKDKYLGVIMKNKFTENPSMSYYSKRSSQSDAMHFSSNNENREKNMNAAHPGSKTASLETKAAKQMGSLDMKIQGADLKHRTDKLISSKSPAKKNKVDLSLHTPVRVKNLNAGAYLGDSPEKKSVGTPIIHDGSNLRTKARSLNRIYTSPEGSQNSAPRKTSKKKVDKDSLSKSEAELISRLTAPTISNSAKTLKSPVKHLTEAKNNENTISVTKNKFLTTTLNPNSKIKSIKGYNTISPIKISPASQLEIDIEDRTSNVRNEHSINSSLKKKSLMVERSVAAAQMRKQKILISMNHKSDPKTSYVSQKIHSKNEADSQVPYSSFKSVEFSKDNKNSDFDLSSRPSAKDLTNRLWDKPKHSNVIREKNTKIIDKQRINLNASSKRKVDSSFSKDASVFYDPRPPNSQTTMYTPDNLPEIHSDDDFSQNRVLKNWATSPNLRLMVSKNSEIDPSTVFGKIESPNIDEIFDSKDSRERARYSIAEIVRNEKS